MVTFNARHRQANTDMNSKNVKLTASVVITMLVIIAIPFAGFTTMAHDNREGLMIDFGYWDVVWTEIVFDDDMDGVDILYIACDINEYPEPDFLDEEETILHSVNGQQSLTGVTWNFYVLPEGASWEAVADPHTIRVKDYALVCWARASGADTVVRGTDASGFTYYSYADKGMSLKTGEKLRIVTLAPSLTEMVASAGGVEYIVGTDAYSDYPYSVMKGHKNGDISYVGGYSDPNYEWILRLSPDVVFCDGSVGEHVNIANKLRKSGINCVVTYDSVDMDTLYNNMWIVASAMGLGKSANDSINAIRSTIDALTGVIGVQQDKKVFFALSTQPSPWTAGSDTYVTDVITGLHGKNIFASQQSSWFMVAKESIHFSQPWFMFIIYEGREITTEKEYFDIIEGLDPLWKDTPAYKNGNIYLFSGDSADVLSRPGPRLGEASELIAKILHQEQFTAKDPLDVVPKYFGDDYAMYLKYQNEVFP